jgi:hypothetical protein
MPIGLGDLKAPMDGGEIISGTRRLFFVHPPEDSWCSSLLEAESAPGP